MMRFLTQNLPTILGAAVVLGLVLSVALRLRHNRKQGKTSCGCDCGSCPNGGACHSK